MNLIHVFNDPAFPIIVREKFVLRPPLPLPHSLSPPSVITCTTPSKSNSPHLWVNWCHPSLCTIKEQSSERDTGRQSLLYKENYLGMWEGFQLAHHQPAQRWCGRWAFMSWVPSASWRRVWRGGPGVGKSYGTPGAQRASHTDQRKPPCSSTKTNFKGSDKTEMLGNDMSELPFI